MLFHLADVVDSYQEISDTITVEEIQDECHSFTLGLFHEMGCLPKNISGSDGGEEPEEGGGWEAMSEL